MRLSPVISAACILLLTGPASAQEFEVYDNAKDGFSVNFPGQPEVEEITWETQYGYMAPGRVYSATRGEEEYSVTVVDYSVLEKQGIARAEECPPGAETCRGNQVAAVIGPGYWKMDVRGALLYALFNEYIEEDVDITELSYNFQELVEGFVVQLTHNDDGARTNAFIAMHENKLYIFEATVPEGYPEPGLFLASISFVNPEGEHIRYQRIYSNALHGLRDYPPPPLTD